MQLYVTLNRCLGVWFVRRKRVEGSILALIGYILSPLSWWNDAFVNIPLSYAIACVLVLFLPKEYFTLLFILAYNGTNVLGFILLHLGVETTVGNEVRLTKKNIVKYIVVSVVYTLVVYVLAELGLAKPAFEYFTFG